MQRQIAHLGGDSDGVLAALAELDDARAGGWSGIVHWMRHVAYRRAGDLDRAEFTLDHAESASSPGFPPSSSSPVCAPTGCAAVSTTSTTVCPAWNCTTAAPGTATCTSRSALELAAHLAWLGDRDRAQAVARPDGRLDGGYAGCVGADPAADRHRSHRHRRRRRSRRDRAVRGRPAHRGRSRRQLVLARPCRSCAFRTCCCRSGDRTGTFKHSARLIASGSNWPAPSLPPAAVTSRRYAICAGPHRTRPRPPPLAMARRARRRRYCRR